MLGKFYIVLVLRSQTLRVWLLETTISIVTRLEGGEVSAPFSGLVHLQFFKRSKNSLEAGEELR